MQNFFNTWPARSWLAPLLTAFAVACGGGGAGADPEPPLPPPSAPVIVQQPANVSVQEGASATFMVAVQDGNGAVYQWLRNGDPVAGAVQSSYIIASATIANTNNRFAVRVSNAAGTVTSAEAVLTVTPPPIVAPPPAISVAIRNLGEVADLATDAQGNTIAVFPVNNATTVSVVARKFAPDGSPVPYGPDGLGQRLPGATGSTRGVSTYSGAAFSASGDIYVSNVKVRDGSINQFAATGGSISRISASGEVTVLVDWPAGSAVAPASITLGPDGSLYFVNYISGWLMKRTSDGVVSAVADVQAVPGNLFLIQKAFWIAVESADRVYVLNWTPFSSSRLLKRVEAGVVTVLAGNDSLGPRVDGTGTAASFISPTGLLMGSGGTLYIADGPLLRAVTPSGVVTTVAGQPGGTVLAPGPLPGSLGTLGPIAIGADGLIHAVSAEANTYSLVKIKLQ